MHIRQIASQSHEQVVEVTDTDTGLHALIAVHSTVLGPAAGGLRMRPYATREAAVQDVLRLSRGMTYKNAAAGLELGGGKAVILGDPAHKTPALLERFGAAIETLSGQYWTAEDMGMTPEDMTTIARSTRFVAGLPDGDFASGDPSPITAKGVFNAIRLSARYRLGRDDLRGCRVAVQGLGHVGWHLAALLYNAGAELVVADMNAARVTEAAQALGATPAPVDQILAADVDILAPCAIGAILSADTIPTLRAQVVAGAANNQLATEADGDALHARGILYAPDYVANAGGIINVATEILQIEDRAAFVAQKLEAAADTLDRIFVRANAMGTSPARVADSTVDEIIARAKAA